MMNQYQTVDMVREGAPQMLNNALSQGQMFPHPVMFKQSNLIPHRYSSLTDRKPEFGGVKQQGRSKWKRGPEKRRKEVEQQNGLKAGKRKVNRRGPYAHAPRNTTSYLIRAKKEGGIASVVSPFPVTPAVLPSPVFSPAREAVVDMAKEEWGVDGYGSMKGLIRLRQDAEEEEEDEEDHSCESDVGEHLEVERRLDQDLTRFEMVCPNYPNKTNSSHDFLLGDRLDHQDAQILQLEEENLSMRQRLYLLEREFEDIKRRMQGLERLQNLDHAPVQQGEEEEEEEEEDIHIHQELMSQNVSEAAEEGPLKFCPSI